MEALSLVKHCIFFVWLLPFHQVEIFKMSCAIILVTLVIFFFFLKFSGCGQYRKKMSFLKTIVGICFELVKKQQQLVSDSQHAYFCRACVPSAVTQEIF